MPINQKNFYTTVIDFMDGEYFHQFYAESFIDAAFLAIKNLEKHPIKYIGPVARQKMIDSLTNEEIFFPVQNLSSVMSCFFILRGQILFLTVIKTDLSI